MFDSYQRIRLRDLAWRQGDPTPDYTKPNVRLEAYIAELQATHPKLFHSKDTLPKRVFVDKPMLLIPHERAVRGPKGSPYLLIERTT